MDVDMLVECHVTTVARQLSRKQRNDVALELRSLLGPIGSPDRQPAPANAH